MGGKRTTRLFGILSCACVLVLSLALAGCGSSSSEVIVGKWNLIGIQTDDGSLLDSWSGNATAGNDGTISIDIESTLRMSGTWEAIPKDKWSQSSDSETVGAYKLSLKMDNTDYASAKGLIIETTNGYAFGIFADDADVALYFDR